jgi:hypothetical protein
MNVALKDYLCLKWNNLKISQEMLNVGFKDYLSVKLKAFQNISRNAEYLFQWLVMSEMKQFKISQEMETVGFNNYLYFKLKLP